MSKAISTVMDAASDMHKYGLISDEELADYERVSESILYKRRLKKMTLAELFDHIEEGSKGLQVVLCDNRPEWIVDDSSEGAEYD